MTIIFHSYSAMSFFSCIYSLAYLIMMLFSLQKFLSLAKINSTPLSAHKTLIILLQSFSTFGSQIQKILTKLSLDCKYIIQNFLVFTSSNIVAYVLLDNNGRQYGPHKLTYTLSSFFLAFVIHFLYITTCIYLLAIYGIYKLLKSLLEMLKLTLDAFASVLVVMLSLQYLKLLFQKLQLVLVLILVVAVMLLL